MKNLQFIIVLLLTVLLFNCSKDSAPIDSASPTPTTPSGTAITYNGNIKSVMTAHCISCHGSPPQDAPMSLTTYTAVKSYINIIIARVNSASNPMPPNGQIPAETRNLFQQWKDGGLLEN